MFNYHSQSISSASLIGSVLLTQCKQYLEEKGKISFFLLGRNQIFFFQLVEPLTAFLTSNTESIMFFLQAMIIIKLTKVKPYVKTLENAEGKKQYSFTVAQMRENDHDDDDELLDVNLN